jgi:hypothetical protein
MKKTILLTCLIINSIATFAQDENVFPEKDGKVYYSEIITVDTGISKNDLFVAARKWFANAYKSANDVIQMQDKESGEIVGKGIVTWLYRIPLNPSVTVNVYHTVSIIVKDGRYKYEITDLNGKYYSPGTQIGTSYIRGNDVEWPLSNDVRGNKKNTVLMYKEVNAKILALIESLKIAMSKAKTGSEDW